MDVDKQKIFDKIKKCLALSKSSNAHEAAAALRQAQKLMGKHGISEEDIEALGYGYEEIEMPVQANKKLPEYINLFLNLMTRAFGVKPIIGRTVRISDESYTVSYFGPTGRVMTAAYAHTVCWRAMSKSWTEHLKNCPWLRGQRGARSSFFMGWIWEVWDKVEAIGFTDEETVKTELAIRMEGIRVRETQLSKIDLKGSALHAGAEAARNFHIHRPMDVEKLRIESVNSNKASSAG